MSALEPNQLTRLYTSLFGLGIAFFFMAFTGAVLLYARRRPRPTREQLADRQAAREAAARDRKLRAAIMAEARWLMREIPHHLAIQQKFETFYREGHVSGRQRHRGGRKIRRRVQFEAVLLTQTEIWFRVNGRKLPTGTSFFDIKDPNNHVLDNLQYGIGRPVRFYEDNEFNFFIRVGLKNSLMGIPKMAYFAKTLEKLPDTNRNTFVVGVNEYGKVIYQDFTKWPHGLILGATGAGKSVAVKQLLITLMLRNTPQALQFHLIDLKRTELPKFAAAPHVKSFTNRAENVQPVLDGLNEELERRLSMFEGVCNDIDGWNHQAPHRRLPRLILLVDELALLTTSRYKSDAVEAFHKLASLGRAAGIHLLLATQTVTKEVLPITILANIEGRICFSVANVSASTLAVGNGSAYGLAPAGRAVFVSGLNYNYVQSPFISHEEIDDALKAICEPEAEEYVPAPLEFLAHIALENYGGQATVKLLYESWENQNSEWKLGQRKIADLLKASEYKPDQKKPATVYYDGQNYILTQGKLGAPTHPRVFMPLNGHMPNIDEVTQYVLQTVKPYAEDGENN